MPTVPPNPVVRVRPAREEDVEAIASIHVATWQVAYAHLFEPGRLAGMGIDPAVIAWRGRLRAPSPRRHVLIASGEGATPVGFAVWGPSRDAGADPREDGELYALYVRPTAWGTGAGRALMERGLALLAEDGVPRATLWVVADNPRARRFYAAAGWAPDGAERTEEIFDTAIRELRYARDVSAVEPAIPPR